MTKKNVFDFAEMKRKGEKVTWITAYDFPMANLAEQAGIDMILVGDSVGMVVYGYPGTLPVTMDQIMYHTEAVRRGAPNTFVVGDMPFLSYQKSVADAIENAGRFYKEANVDAVKLEGGKRVTPQIKGIVDSGMVVIGHIGLTPQSSAQMGGFKTQGNTAEAAMVLLDDARAIEEAGASILLVEGVPPETGKIITETLSIPVYGIGAGPYCDGQILVFHDLVGYSNGYLPKFVKKYADIHQLINQAVQGYMEDVKKGNFPNDNHSYHLKPELLQKIIAKDTGTSGKKKKR